LAAASPATPAASPAATCAWPPRPRPRPRPRACSTLLSCCDMNKCGDEPEVGPIALLATPPGPLAADEIMPAGEEAEAGNPYRVGAAAADAATAGAGLAAAAGPAALLPPACWAVALATTGVVGFAGAAAPAPCVPETVRRRTISCFCGLLSAFQESDWRGSSPRCSAAANSAMAASSGSAIAVRTAESCPVGVRCHLPRATRNQPRHTRAMCRRASASVAGGA
jgi:hypothetical protein